MAFETSIKIDADTRGAERNITSMNRRLRTLGATAQKISRAIGGAFDRLKRQVFNLRNAFVVLAAGLAIRQLIKVGSTFEQLRIQLKTVTGDVIKAEQAFEGIKDLAIETPFAVENLTTSFIRLKAIGIEPTRDLMIAFGDVAAGLGRDIVDFTRAATGAAFGETEALKTFGIAAKAQGDQIAFTFKGVTTVVEREANAVIGALKKIGQENFAGAAEAQVDSFKGAVNNFGDAMSALLDQAARAGPLDFFATTVRALSEELTNLTDIEAGSRFGEAFARGMDRALLGVADFTEFAAPAVDFMIGAGKRIVAGFNALPEPLKLLGLFGLIFLGTKGKIAILIGLALVDEVKAAMKELQAVAEKIGEFNRERIRELGGESGKRLRDAIRLKFGSGETDVDEHEEEIVDKIAVRQRLTQIEIKTLREMLVINYRYEEDVVEEMDDDEVQEEFLKIYSL